MCFVLCLAHKHTLNINFIQNLNSMSCHQTLKRGGKGALLQSHFPWHNSVLSPHPAPSSFEAPFPASPTPFSCLVPSSSSLCCPLPVWLTRHYSPSKSGETLTLNSRPQDGFISTPNHPLSQPCWFSLAPNYRWLHSRFTAENPPHPAPLCPILTSRGPIRF